MLALAAQMAAFRHLGPEELRVEWTLRDRLDQAEADRRLAAGLPPTSPEKPLDPPGATFGRLAWGRAEPAASAITRGLPVWVARPAPPAMERPAEPSGLVDAVVDAVEVIPTECACPNCAGPTRIDMLDLVLGVEHLTCIDCGLIFTTAARPTR
jgi:hypothetical protein